MSKVVSDDSARRALKKIDVEQGVPWLQQHLHRCFDPLLQEDWILDCDITGKPVVRSSARRIFAWCWMLRCKRGKKRPPSIQHQAYGPYWSGYLEPTGPS